MIFFKWNEAVHIYSSIYPIINKYYIIVKKKINTTTEQ